MSSDDEEDDCIRIINIGPAGVGKTTFCFMIKFGQFVDKTKTTIGVGDYQKLNVSVARNTVTVPVELIDTAGMERFAFLHNDYYRSCLGAIIMFDASKEQSLALAVHGFERLQSLNRNAPALFIGNMRDKMSDNDADRTAQCDSLRDKLVQMLGKAPPMPVQFVSLRDDGGECACNILTVIVERIVLDRVAQQTSAIARTARNTANDDSDVSSASATQSPRSTRRAVPLDLSRQRRHADRKRAALAARNNNQCSC